MLTVGCPESELADLEPLLSSAQDSFGAAVACSFLIHQSYTVFPIDRNVRKGGIDGQAKVSIPFRFHFWPVRSELQRQ